MQLLNRELEIHFNQYEVILVSDGNSDFFNQQLEKNLKPNSYFQLLTFPQRQGKGMALRGGIEKAKGDLIAFIDGGMEIHPRHIAQFTAELVRQKKDIIIGSKRHPQSFVIYPWYRWPATFIFQKIVKLFFRIHFSDTQVGLKIFQASLLKSIAPYLKTKTYGIDLEILYWAQCVYEAQIIEAPVQLNYKQYLERNLFSEIAHMWNIVFLLGKDTIKLFFTLHLKHSRRNTLLKI